MKLRGQTIKVEGTEYTLREQLGEGGFSLIHLTNHPNIICKAQVLHNPQVKMAYYNEKYYQLTQKHPTRTVPPQHRHSSSRYRGDP